MDTVSDIQSGFNILDTAMKATDVRVIMETFSDIQCSDCGRAGDDVAPCAWRQSLLSTLCGAVRDL
jgi:hypothetical protein